MAAFSVVDVDQQRAAVRTIQRADGVADVGHLFDYRRVVGVVPLGSALDLAHYVPLGC